MLFRVLTLIFDCFEARNVLTVVYYGCFTTKSHAGRIILLNTIIVFMVDSWCVNAKILANLFLTLVSGGWGKIREERYAVSERT